MKEAQDFWREKLKTYERDLAITADPAQNFQLKQFIEEAKVKITELEKETPGSALAMGQNKIAPSRLRHSADHLVGRDSELQRLTDAWNNPDVHVVTIVAWAGVGKTSLVARWQAGLAQHHYDGAHYFDWSLYSQGAREQGTASADSFITAALEFFGDPDMAKSPTSPWDKGARLAHLIGQRRSLLVLDGLEPLQYPPTSSLAGQLKDPALAALLKGLAANNPGLCLVTTRERVADLASFRQITAPEWQLEDLSVPAGIELLEKLGVRGAQKEFEQLVNEVKGHALTLNLLGRYLAEAHGGDICKRDQVRFEEADAEEQGGHAFRVMGTYEKWLDAQGEKGRRSLAVLRLLALFDRPADAGCLAALRKPPTILGLTEPVVNLTDAQWNVAVNRLAGCGLVSIQRPDESTPSGQDPQLSLDLHQLVREYFARQVRGCQAKAWQKAHARIYRHLRGSTRDTPQPGLDDLQPLYQAVAHGCQAGMQQETFDTVLRSRISRGCEFYSAHKLGAFGAELGAVACFFEQPWKRLLPMLSRPAQAWLLNHAGSCLRAAGRITEALEPMRAALELLVQRKDWQNAARASRNLGELNLMLGYVAAAVHDAKQGVAFAKASDSAIEIQGTWEFLGEALHQAGRRSEASDAFVEAQHLEARVGREFLTVYVEPQFAYHDLLLGNAERAAWQCHMGISSASASLRLAAEREPAIERVGSSRTIRESPFPDTCQRIQQAVKQTLPIALQKGWLSNVALDHLTLGRIFLYQAMLENSKVRDAEFEVDHAVDGLRRAGQQADLPKGLLTRAWLRIVLGDTASAQADLDEAQEIAKRGYMKLFLVDIHLCRARLFFRAQPYPWTSPRADLAAARQLIEGCGYSRRKEELEDAEEIILTQKPS